MRNDLQGVIRVLGIRRYPLRLWYLPAEDSTTGFNGPNMIDGDGEAPPPIELPATSEEREAQGWKVRLKSHGCGDERGGGGFC
jgi:hypothetical protein